MSRYCKHDGAADTCNECYDAMKAELERTEKVYRMNREYVESAKEKLAALRQSLNVAREALGLLSLFPQGVPPDQPHPTEIEYAMAEIASVALTKLEAEK